MVFQKAKLFINFSLTTRYDASDLSWHLWSFTILALPTFRLHILLLSLYSALKLSKIPSTLLKKLGSLKPHKLTPFCSLLQLLPTHRHKHWSVSTEQCLVGLSPDTIKYNLFVLPVHSVNKSSNKSLILILLLLLYPLSPNQNLPCSPILSKLQHDLGKRESKIPQRKLLLTVSRIPTPFHHSHKLQKLKVPN